MSLTLPSFQHLFYLPHLAGSYVSTLVCAYVSSPTLLSSTLSCLCHSFFLSLLFNRQFEMRVASVLVLFILACPLHRLTALPPVPFTSCPPLLFKHFVAQSPSLLIIHLHILPVRPATCIMPLIISAFFLASGPDPSK